MRRKTKALLSGASTVIDLGGRAFRRSIRNPDPELTPGQYDALALYNDWLTVGETISEVMGSYGEEEKEKLTRPAQPASRPSPA